MFWLLDSPDNVGDVAEWVHEEMRLETVACPINDGHQRPGRRLTELAVWLPRDPGDVAWTWYSECLIQDRVLRVLEANRFTGFHVKAVKAKVKNDVMKDGLPQMWELVVTGWAGIAPPESGITLVERCDACGYMYYSSCSNSEKLIDETQWDGSDVFMVWPLPKYIFVTDRVAQVIREEKWTGVRITALKDVRCGGSGLSPGRLSYVMPLSRASQLGESLGIC